MNAKLKLFRWAVVSFIASVTLNLQAAQPVMLKEIVPGNQLNLGPEIYTAIDNTLFFMVRWNPEVWWNISLWKTDGTADGTEYIKAINPRFVSNYGYLESFTAGRHTVLGDTLFFTTKHYYTTLSGEERSDGQLWKSDGTPEGTMEIEYIESDVPQSLIAYKNRLYFVTYASGSPVLWSTDGTKNGAVQIKTFNSDDGDVHVSNPIVAGNTLYFSVGHTGTWGANHTEPWAEIWKTDGSINGTQLLKRFSNYRRVVNDWTSFNDQLLFISEQYDPILGIAKQELWTSDGTSTGTKMIDRLGKASAAYRYPFTTMADKLYFIAGDANRDSALWKTSGAPGSTVRIRSFPDNTNTPGFSSVSPESVVVGNDMYFTIQYPKSGAPYELWKSNGTTAGTTLLTGTTSFNQNLRFIQQLTSFDRTLYFTAYDRVRGYEIWKSNGTPNGTRIVKDINPDPAGNGTCCYEVMVDTMYFVADDGVHGRELWKLESSFRALNAILLPLLLDSE